MMLWEHSFAREFYTLQCGMHNSKVVFPKKWDHFLENDPFMKHISCNMFHKCPLCLSEVPVGFLTNRFLWRCRNIFIQSWFAHSFFPHGWWILLFRTTWNANNHRSCSARPKFLLNKLGFLFWRENWRSSCCFRNRNWR